MIGFPPTVCPPELPRPREWVRGAIRSEGMARSYTDVVGKGCDIRASFGYDARRRSGLQLVIAELMTYEAQYHSSSAVIFGDVALV